MRFCVRITSPPIRWRSNNDGPLPAAFSTSYCSFKAKLHKSTEKMINIFSWFISVQLCVFIRTVRMFSIDATELFGSAFGIDGVGKNYTLLLCVVLFCWQCFGRKKLAVKLVNSASKWAENRTRRAWSRQPKRKHKTGIVWWSEKWSAIIIVT